MSKCEPNCIFCDLIKDSENVTFVADFEFGRLFVNLSQTYFGRCIFIFKNHVKDITKADIDKEAKFIIEMAIISRALKKLLNFDRIDCATLGNVVQHYHWHLIPRYISDLNYMQEAPWPHTKKQASKEELEAMVSKIYDALINYQDDEVKIQELDNNKRILRILTNSTK